MNDNVRRVIVMVLIADLGFGIGPINWTMKGIHKLKMKNHEKMLQKTLEEGHVAVIYIDKKARRGYVYIMRKGVLIKSYFSEYITKPKWALDAEE